MEFQNQATEIKSMVLEVLTSLEWGLQVAFRQDIFSLLTSLASS